MEDRAGFASSIPHLKLLMEDLALEVERLAREFSWNATKMDDEPAGSQQRREETVRHGLLELLLPVMTVEEYELHCLVGSDPLHWEREEMISWIRKNRSDEVAVAICWVSTRKNEHCLYDD